MGYIMIRMKKHVVGDESQHVVLFRCIQTMSAKVPYNTCYTGGDDHVPLKFRLGHNVTDKKCF